MGVLLRTPHANAMVTGLTQIEFTEFQTKTSMEPPLFGAMY